MILASSWADVPNWPLMSGGKNDLEHDRENNKKDKDTISRCDIELSILDKLDKLYSEGCFVGFQKYQMFTFLEVTTLVPFIMLIHQNQLTLHGSEP